MAEKIYKKDGKLVIEIPLKTKRYNPYDEKDYGDEMDNIIGLIESDIDMGFCFRIDMSYKGKDDQWTDYFFKWLGSKDVFEKMCKDLNFDIVYETYEAITKKSI